jgi:LCP family protein required for cell wall assembly
MTRLDDDRDGAKPYKTYKAHRTRRSQVDDELAGARPAPERAPSNERDRREPGAPAGRPSQGDKEYRTYGSSSDPGGAPRPVSTKPAGLRRRRRFYWWYVPVGVFAALVIAGVVLTVLAWPGYHKFDRAVDASNKRVDTKTRAQLTPDKGWIWRNGTTVLLLGVDKKASDTTARSDTIMLLHFDPKSRTVNQLSIPRDTKVDVPRYGSTKINEAMFWGGSSLALQTVKDYTRIPINHVMVVSFQGFPRLVNAVGGVDFYVPETVTTEVGSAHRPVVFKKGMHHFNGKYALLYVRIRKAYANGDFTRAARQQAFVQALEKKIVRPSNVTKLPEFGRKFMSGVATDLTTNQILELAYLKWRATGGKKQVMAGVPGYENGVAYVFPPDPATREKMIKRFLGE